MLYYKVTEAMTGGQMTDEKRIMEITDILFFFLKKNTPLGGIRRQEADQQDTESK